jgi:uncharacterized protein (DUF3820 family)
MQAKLTLTIEENLIEHAKGYAKSKGRSLSDLIESYLKLLLKDQSSELKLSKEIMNLKGAVKLPDDFNYKVEVGKALGKKYDL